MIGSGTGCGTGAAIEDGGAGTTEPGPAGADNGDGDGDGAAGAESCTPAGDDSGTGAPTGDVPVGSCFAEDAAGRCTAVGDPESVPVVACSTSVGPTVSIGTLPGSGASVAVVLPLPRLALGGGACARSPGGDSASFRGCVADAPFTPPRVANSAVAAASPINITTTTRARSTRSRRVPTSGGRNVRHGQRPQRSVSRRCSWALSE